MAQPPCFIAGREWAKRGRFKCGSSAVRGGFGGKAKGAGAPLGNRLLEDVAEAETDESTAGIVHHGVFTLKIEFEVPGQVDV